GDAVGRVEERRCMQIHARRAVSTTRRVHQPNGVRPEPRSHVNASESLNLTEEVKSTIRVMIVDDEATLRESCASVLSVEGYDVTTCGSGHEALTILKRRQFDIVLLDLHMSQVFGMD